MSGVFVRELYLLSRLRFSYDLNGWRNVHPSFHLEQPYAAFPLMMMPRPHTGQAFPIQLSSIFCGAAFGAEAFVVARGAFGVVFVGLFLAAG